MEARDYEAEMNSNSNSNSDSNSNSNKQQMTKKILVHHQLVLWVAELW